MLVAKKKLMYKPSEIRRWDVLRTQQYHEEKTFQGQQHTSVIEPPMIALLKKQKGAEISTSVAKKHAFGLVMMMMMMSWLKTLNKMSAAIHCQSLFLMARRRMISIYPTHFTST